MGDQVSKQSESSCNEHAVDQCDRAGGGDESLPVDVGHTRPTQRRPRSDVDCWGRFRQQASFPSGSAAAMRWTPMPPDVVRPIECSREVAGRFRGQGASSLATSVSRVRCAAITE
jgi:hypothetical protein